MNGYILNGNRFQLFNYKNLGSVRTSKGEDGRTWFCLNDICHILEIQNPRDLLKRISQPYVDTIYVWVQTGIKTDGTPAMRETAMNFVSEAGLYMAIGQSRKPEARLFMNWIFNEVLPTINKTGAYLTDEVITELRKNPNYISNIIEENLSLRDKLQAYDSYAREKDGQINELWDRLSEYEDID